MQNSCDFGRQISERIYLPLWINILTGIFSNDETVIAGKTRAVLSNDRTNADIRRDAIRRDRTRSFT